MNENEALAPVEDMGRQLLRFALVSMLLTLIAAFLMTEPILRRVNAVIAASRKLASGDLTARVAVTSRDELGQLGADFNLMATSIQQKTETIEIKNQQNEALLLNILPSAIAVRLKEGEDVIADSFSEVSVLFADIVGFTEMSGTRPPKELVEYLNDLFRRFDAIAARLGVEKIKTIGDAYMAVAGLPRARPDHAEVMARMALEMVQEVGAFSRDRGQSCQVRVGLHSGPVVAGVIGATKFIYDLWGDTVNIASRMEAHGVPGSVQVTRAIYERLQSGFDFEPRGFIDVKGKGRMEAWLLLRPRQGGQVAAAPEGL